MADEIIQDPSEGEDFPVSSQHHCRRCDMREGPRGKFHSFNYLADVPGGYADSQMVEVQFKNTRKGYYLNSLNLPLEIGDMVAVEAQPGHDIGQVTLIGNLVHLQMRKANIKPDAEIRRVFRKARQADLDKYEEAKAKENDTMIRSRKIASSLQLNMKIGDVEYQGDGNKAIFYYIADERVDFRQLIKVLAETFKVRIEMKQIGARQEAGRIGGIGPCGRPLCCSSWMSNFVSVATSAARYQDISLNPQKLAGQCAKLKCCLNFEVDTYVESLKHLPGKEIRLETADATYFLFKTDVFKRELTYSTDKNIPANLVTIDPARAFEIIAMNKEGEKPLSLKREGDEKPQRQFNDILDKDGITRFDKKKKKRNKSQGNKGDKPQQQQGNKGDKPQQQQGNKGDKPQQQQANKGDKPQQQQANKGDKPQQQGNKGNRPQQQKGPHNNKGNRPEKKKQQNQGNNDPKPE